VLARAAASPKNEVAGLHSPAGSLTMSPPIDSNRFSPDYAAMVSAMPGGSFPFSHFAS
jgi:hypothetical protein